MPGFGKRNARGLSLRTVMIYAAAEVFEKEKDSRRLLEEYEIHDLVQLVCRAHDVKPSHAEFSNALAGTKTLTMNRAFIESISNRWSRGPVTLRNDDLKTAGEILENGANEIVSLRPFLTRVNVATG